MPGRRKPYTQIGIRRAPCVRCGRPAECQWQVCADNNLYRPLCAACDIAVNTCLLRFMRDPDWQKKMERYRQRLSTLAIHPQMRYAKPQGRRGQDRDGAVSLITRPAIV